ncbi:hypothetical protein ACWGJP_09955 [Microbacterium sp. NPDC055903]
MEISRTRLTRTASLGLVALLAGGMLGCSPEPDPEPTPTAAFASEEEAFAKAEEVYRAYIAAEDARHSDEAADPRLFLTGRALEEDTQAQETLRENGVHLAGATRIAAFVGQEARIDDRVGTIVVAACLDVSLSRVLDETGADVTPPSREDLWPLEVVFAGNRNELLIASSDTGDPATCS